ncbi:hypothetical protein TWF281_002793 [Arthrobotrys megalospora]
MSVEDIIYLLEFYCLSLEKAADSPQDAMSSSTHFKPTMVPIGMNEEEVRENRRLCLRAIAQHIGLDPKKLDHPELNRTANS